MPNPKRRHSRSRTRKRRTNQGLPGAAYVSCPQCTEPKLPHRVCPHCGYYNGKPVVEVEEI